MVSASTGACSGVLHVAVASVDCQEADVSTKQKNGLFQLATQPAAVISFFFDSCWLWPSSIDDDFALRPQQDEGCVGGVLVAHAQVLQQSDPVVRR